ncbi:ComF family protein [Paucisalibacillus sp. EB02]|uniref:ComF family protein n=1 Tax=Paucisalibacillus sp. EB02 TaxID=1347087 RepID=UPI0004ADF1E1|nr:ComF family protein [Paucisalibacillus sp. EB02]
MNCLWCHEELIMEVNWSNVTFPTKVQRICEICEKELVLLSGNRCRRCSRETESDVCNDCLWWENYHQGKDVIEYNYSVFQYTSHIQDIIAKWKYRGDYELGHIFEKTFYQHFQQTFKEIKNAVAVPIPLSSERIQERCFNQASMLTAFLPVRKLDILSRVHGEKQSKKTRQERISSENPFILHQTLNNPVILVDDIYTTGATLRHAARLLKKAGCTNVYTYTLVRG